MIEQYNIISSTAVGGVPTSTAKIETPEEFARGIESVIVPKYAESPNGRGGLTIISKDYTWAVKLIAARDAAIRADERAKAAERAVQWVNKNLADEHMPLLYKRLEEGELRLAITCGEAVPDPRDALIEQMGKALMELRECMTEIAGYELPKNWADEALAAYKEAQHG